MPSSLEPSRAQRLADVYARAERLRRQRRARLGTGALLGSLAVFMVGLLVGSNLGITQQLTTIGRPDAPSTTATTDSPTTTDAPSTTAANLPVVPDSDAQGNPPPDGEVAIPPPPTPQIPSTSTTASTRPEPPAGTSTTVASCRNSRDPACGPLRYDPPPANEAMMVVVTFSPEAPKAGETVTFTVRVREDGPVTRGPGACNEATFGDEETARACSASCALPEPRHGPWDPPPPEDTSFTETFRHTYAEAGDYTANFAYNQGQNCTSNPYYSAGETPVTVPVR